jgi:hypothetical protein
MGKIHVLKVKFMNMHGTQVAADEAVTVVARYKGTVIVQCAERC